MKTIPEDHVKFNQNPLGCAWQTGPTTSSIGADIRASGLTAIRTFEPPCNEAMGSELNMLKGLYIFGDFKKLGYLMYLAPKYMEKYVALA